MEPQLKEKLSALHKWVERYNILTWYCSQNPNDFQAKDSLTRNIKALHDTHGAAILKEIQTQYLPYQDTQEEIKKALERKKRVYDREDVYDDYD